MRAWPAGTLPAMPSGLPDLAEQRHATLALIKIRSGTFAQRRGAPIPDDHV
jgi:hypothetical protein